MQSYRGLSQTKTSPMERDPHYENTKETSLLVPEHLHLRQRRKSASIQHQAPSIYPDTDDVSGSSAANALFPDESDPVSAKATQGHFESTPPYLHIFASTSADEPFQQARRAILSRRASTPSLYASSPAPQSPRTIEYVDSTSLSTKRSWSRSSLGVNRYIIRLDHLVPPLAAVRPVHTGYTAVACLGRSQFDSLRPFTSVPHQRPHLTSWTQRIALDY